MWYSFITTPFCTCIAHATACRARRRPTALQLLSQLLSQLFLQLFLQPVLPPVFQPAKRWTQCPYYKSAWPFLPWIWHENCYTGILWPAGNHISGIEALINAMSLHAAPKSAAFGFDLL